MVKSMLVAALLATLGTGLGCAVDPEQLGTTAGITFEEFKARTSVEPGTGNYVVDWDTIIHGDDELLEFYYRFQQGALAIYTAGGVDVKWDAVQRKNLTYCVSDAFGAQKAQVVAAMKFASDDGWEKFADVNFTYLPTQDANCNADNIAVMFDVSPITGAPYTARAFFPNSPRHERNVLVDSTAFAPDIAVPLQNILAHELGHTLGFRHEHIRPEAAATECAEDTQFRGITPYDSASVMHYPQCNGTSATLAFTARDQQGVQMVYGPPTGNAAPMAQVVSPVNGATVGRSFQVQASVVDTDLAGAELVIDGTVKDTLSAAPFTFQVTGLAVGQHTLEIRATDSGGQTGTQTIQITVSPNAPSMGGEDEVITGGCSTTGGSSAGLVLGFGFVGARRRRR
ncbi:MAG: Ig-like domain-containing protein [Kofleriaceae bacterium]|nr:Ig-like domain-containing protein [Kofleriaceae bacterium]